jgi:hypothetical protein
MPDRPDPPVTPRDRACAAFARAALFPLSVDWSGQHHAIYPALQALDLVRTDLVNERSTPFSALFPRRVMIVRSTTKSETVKWNGQPDIVDSSVEVIPNVLMVKCMECSDDDSSYGTANAFVRTKEDRDKNACHEIVLCTNRLLRRDYSKSKDPALLEQQRDLPPRSLAAVEEALAHQIQKVRAQQHVDKDESPCEQLAAVEVQAARLAECLFQKQGTEIRRGSCLKPPGFSLLPGFLQQNFRNRCVRAVATQATAGEFGKAEGRKCVNKVLDRSSQ